MSRLHVSERDYILARLTVTLAHLESATEDVKAITDRLIDPKGDDEDDGNGDDEDLVEDHDLSGAERDEAFESALDAVGLATRALEEASRVWSLDIVRPDEGEDYDSYGRGDDPEPEADADIPRARARRARAGGRR